MKKFFLFAAAVVAAMTVKADVFDFATIAAQSDFEINGANLNTSESSDTKFVYDVEENIELAFVANVAPDFTFKYKNSSAKAKAFIVNAGNSIEFGGKNGRIEIANLIDGDELHFLVAAKGSKASKISIVDNAGEVIGENTLTLPKKDKSAEGADKDGYVYLDWKVVVTSDMFVDGLVLVKETENGFRIKLATLNEDLPQGIEDVVATGKAVKVFENGQLVIIKNGVRYNALGAAL